MNQFIILECDKKQCENCSSPRCVGTTQEKHAVNFVAFETGNGIYYTEKTLVKSELENQKSKEENQKKKMKIQRRKSKKENENSKEKNEVLEDVKE